MKKIYYIILLSFFSCLTKNENGNNSIKKNSSEVYISGTSDEVGFNESVNIDSESNFYNKLHKKETNYLKDTVNINFSEIESPKIFEFSGFGNNTYYPVRVFITPGDSIHFELKNGILNFKGKNSGHYNFFLELEQKFDPWTDLKFSKLNADFIAYKKQCDSFYNSRLQFLNDYIKKHKRVSNEFKSAIKEELKLEYLLNLIRPRSEVQDIYTINTSEDLTTIIKNANRDEGDFFDLDNYLNNINLQDLNKPHLVNNMYYKMSIIPLIRQYFVKSKEKPFSKESFKQELKFIKHNFNDTIVKYVTGRLIVDYYNRGFGKDKNSNEFMKTTIKEYKKTITDPTYIEAVEDIQYELNALNEIVPKNLKEFVINLSKDTININSILNSKQIKVIDYWASWCQHCVKEIVVGNEIRKELVKKYNLQFIYFSVDKDSEQWIKQSNYFKKFLANGNQFKVLNLNKSKFIKFLNIKNSYGLSIPRYVILDTENKVIDNNAPKPSNEKFEQVIEKLLEK